MSLTSCLFFPYVDKNKALLGIDRASQVAQSIKNLRVVQEPWVRSLGQGRPSGVGNGIDKNKEEERHKIERELKQTQLPFLENQDLEGIPRSFLSGGR